MAATPLPIQGLHFGPRRFLAAREEQLAKLSFEHFRARRLAPVIGAEIEGIDLRDPNPAALEELERAFYAYRVLFFRGQDLTTEQHLRFAAHFGELEDHPFLPGKDGYAPVIQFAKDADTVGVENNWHSDVSWREIPSLGSVLRAVTVPDVGGDTLFADMVMAYEGLPDELKERIEGRTATHDFLQAFGYGLSDEDREKARAQYPPASHPIVRTHPVTGEKILYVNRIFTARVDDMDPAESNELIARLCREAEVPEYQVRFAWQPNSVAFWDNRAVHHYAASDYWPKQRVMERVTIIGERPY